jgi:hypothetical protein
MQRNAVIAADQASTGGKDFCIDLGSVCCRGRSKCIQEEEGTLEMIQ